MGESIRDFEEGRDEAGVADLWTRVFGVARGGQTIEWLFRPGPAGASPRSVAEADGRIVAHAGGAALRFRLGGEDVRGAYSVGAMTDPAYQGRGLFFRLGRHLYERLAREGFAFVAGFSNARSHRLMTGPLGRTAIRPFPWAMRVLRPFGLARALLGGAGARPTPPIPAPLVRGAVTVLPTTAGDPRLDAVWKRAAPAVDVGSVRDSAFATWRYASRPDAGYRLWVAERDGDPTASLAYRAMEVRGVRAGFLLDLLVAPGEPGAGAALLEAAAVQARGEGAAVLSALLPGAGPAREALRAAGFLRIPEPMHPQVIRFSVRGLGRFADSTLLPDPRAWHLCWADTDVV